MSGCGCGCVPLTRWGCKPASVCSRPPLPSAASAQTHKEHSMAASSVTTSNVRMEEEQEEEEAELELVRESEEGLNHQHNQK